MCKCMQDIFPFILEMFLTRVCIGQHIYSSHMSKDAVDDLMEKGEKSECVASIVTGGHDSVLALEQFTTAVEIILYEPTSGNEHYDTDMVNDEVIL